MAAPSEETDSKPQQQDDAVGEKDGEVIVASASDEGRSSQPHNRRSTERRQSSHGRSRSRSGGPLSRHRSSSRSAREDARTTRRTGETDRHRGRERSMSRERGGHHSKDGSHHSKERGRERPSHHDRSHSRSRHDDDDDASVRRRRKSAVEQDKRSTYLKTNSEQRKEKEMSEGRKSSVLGSLTAFLEEGAAAKPKPEPDSGDHSVVSSASRIRRRRQASTPSGGFGGHVTSRDEVRQKRRTRSHSASVGDRNKTVDASMLAHRRKDSRGVTRAASASATDHSHRHKPSSAGEDSTDPEPSQTSSAHPRLQRRGSLTSTSSNGAEIPPGFPVVAVDKASAPIADDAADGNANNTGVLESTAKIRARQMRRASMSGSDLQGLAPQPVRTNRRRASMGALSNNVVPALTATPDEQIDHSVSQETPGGDTNEEAQGYTTETYEDYTTPLGDEDASPSISTRASVKYPISASSCPPTPDGATDVSTIGGSDDDLTDGETDRTGERSIDGTTPKKSKRRASMHAFLGTLSDGLSKIARSKSSKKKNKGDGSVASAPVTKKKDKKKEKKKEKKDKKKEKKDKKKTKKKGGKMHFEFELDDNDDDDLSETLMADLAGSMEDVMKSSNTSLDPTKFDEGAEAINAKAKVYGDEGQEGEMKLNDESIQSNLGEIFKNDLGASNNLSMVSMDPAILARATSASHRDRSPDSSASSILNSPGILTPKGLPTMSASARDMSRVSWIELPLNNPETLLVKSADTDGTNETATMTTIDAVTELGAGEDGGVELLLGSLEAENSESVPQNGKEEVPKEEGQQEEIPKEESPNEAQKEEIAAEANADEASPVEANAEVVADAPVEEASKAKRTVEKLLSPSKRKDKPKRNPSLDVAFKKDSSGRRRKSTSDDRTVGTTTTANTNTSEATMKTTNLTSEPAPPSKARRNSIDAKAEDNPLEKLHESITAADLPKTLSQESSGSLSHSGRLSPRKSKELAHEGSSGSLSRKGSKDDSLHKKKITRKRSSKSSSSHKSKDRNDSRQGKGKEGGSMRDNRNIRKDESAQSRDQVGESLKDHGSNHSKRGMRDQGSTHSRLSKSREGESSVAPESNDGKLSKGRGSSHDDKHSKSEGSDPAKEQKNRSLSRDPSGQGRDLKRRTSRRLEATSSSSSTVKKAGEKIKFVSKKEDGNDSSDDKARLRLTASNSAEADDNSLTRRRTSYLPRKSTKNQKDKSKELKSSIMSSLDTFLEKMGDDVAPVSLDDNRSVHSAVRPKERRRPSREERITRRVTRRPRRGGERGIDRMDSDDLSVLSAPALSSKQTRRLMDDNNRPVVNLKGTGFSSKLKKLDVAF